MLHITFTGLTDVVIFILHETFHFAYYDARIGELYVY